MDIERRWRNENGIGHWEILINGKFAESCEDHELAVVMEEIRKSYINY